MTSPRPRRGVRRARAFLVSFLAIRTSARTVESHIYRAMQKLGVGDRRLL
jgi:hypothetical protein